MAIQLEASWLDILNDEFSKDYMNALKVFLKKEKEVGHVIYPKSNEIFNAFTHTPFNSVKVVILGQDPYHGPNQAHGLSFSVPKGIKPPPSLQNIFKEIQTDIPGFELPVSGDLTFWAEQGVLLLNATLTVRAKTPGSHQNKGWEIFTDQVIREISNRKKGIVFLLWGKYAQAKALLIDNEKHHILTAPHPSPYSAHSGFFGCRHFSKTNEILLMQNQPTINWQLPAH
jgi:uracil-DNA glycosylase